MEFTTAYILGVDRRNDYFGERTVQYRSVDTISIEGYIDVRASNTDYKGVRQTLAQIDAYVAAAANPSVTENIIINGTGFGTGRLININFPASQAVEEDQILFGKYAASIEVYNSGDLRDCLEGFSVPHLQYLENFSEDVSISLDEENIYTLSHSLDITYLSGLSSGALTVEPIETAKQLASGLFAQVPTQYSTIIPDSYGGINSAARGYYTENYNLIDGSTSFEKTIRLLPSGMSNYSLQVSNTFTFDEAGIVKVSEDGNIEPRSPEYLDEARSGLNEEIDKSYSRCNAIYLNYKDYIGTNEGTLFNQSLVTQKSFNNSAGTATYSVEYTDDLNIQNLTSIESREISLSNSENVTTVTENGTVTSINSKFSGFNPYSLIPDRSTVKTRCQNYYTNNTIAQNQYALKNLDNKISIPKYGKAVSYSYSFTNDAEIFDVDDDSIFAKKQIIHSDKIGVPNQTAMIIPNVSNAVLHTPNQTSLGNRNTRIHAQLRRPRFTSNIDNPTIPTSAINSAKTDAIQDAYMVFANNNLISSLNKGQIYITSVNYSFDSDNSFNMSVDSAFTMERIDGNAELNLSFSPPS